MSFYHQTNTNRCIEGYQVVDRLMMGNEVNFSE